MEGSKRIRRHGSNTRRGNPARISIEAWYRRLSGSLPGRMVLGRSSAARSTPASQKSLERRRFRRLKRRRRGEGRGR